jgi:hypothetical protein
MKKILLSIAILMIVTALLVKIAYLQRGYFAIGGECLIWIFPLLIIMASNGDRKEEESSASSSKTTKRQAQEEKAEWV